MKTLDEIKDEYAREFGYSEWGELYASGQSLNNKTVTEIATRFAAEQNKELTEVIEIQKKQMIAVRNAIKMMVDIYKAEGISVQTLESIVTKTAHYEN